jgi:hypothetical protein
MNLLKFVWMVRVLAPAMVFIATACGRGDMPETGMPEDTATGPLRVAEVLMGTSVGPDGKVTAPATQFRGTDTIHVSVATTGRGQDATLILVVTADGDSVPVVRENKFISPVRALVTPYSFSGSPSLKAGRYRVEVFLNGGLAELKEFEVVR